MRGTSLLSFLVNHRLAVPTIIRGQGQGSGSKLYPDNNDASLPKVSGKQQGYYGSTWDSGTESKNLTINTIKNTKLSVGLEGTDKKVDIDNLVNVILNANLSIN